MTTGIEPAPLDGNAAAGPLQELFAFDVTTATARCDGCGRAGPLAEARVWNQAPGLVARCGGCQAVLLRLVRTPAASWLDLRGVSWLQVATG